MSIVSVLQGHEKECSDFTEITVFKRYGVKTSEKANMRNQHWIVPRPGLARSANLGRIKLLRGCVSKPTYDRAASLRGLEVGQPIN